MSDGSLLSVEQAATYLGVPVRLARRLFDTRQVELVKLPRRIFVAAAELDRYVTEHTETTSNTEPVKSTGERYPLLTCEQAAHASGLPVSAVRRLVTDRRVPVVKIGKRTFVTSSAWRGYLAGCVVHARGGDR